MSLFGKPFGTTTAPTTGGLFGTQSTTNTTGGGLFGSQSASNTTGGSLFGTQPTTGAPATGSTTTGGGLFGGLGQSTANTTASAPGSTGTGLFGQPAATSTAGTGLFGQPAAGTGTLGTGTTTGLFGQPATGTTTAATGGLFGQPAAGAASNTTSTVGAGLFGQPAASNTTPAAGAGLFGQPAAGASTTPGAGGLFGQPAAATTSTPGTGLFGQPPSTGGTSTPGAGLFGQTAAKPGGLFGGSTAAPGTTGAGLFGQPAAPKPGGLFGTSTTAGFGLGSTTAQPQQQHPGGLNAHGAALIGLLTKLQQLQQAIQASIPQNPLAGPTPVTGGHQESLEMVAKLGSLLYSLSTEKFQHVFYNVVDSSQVGLYTRPSYVSEALWDKAVKENPDPRCMVPAFAFGMEDLQKRADAQVKAAEACKAKLDEIRTKLTTLSQKHVISTSLRSQKLSNNHTLLFQRVVRLSQHLHLLIPLVRSSAIRPEEEQLRGRLESMEDDLRRGSASKGRMNEIWGVIGQLTALKAREGMEASGEGNEWAVVDEEGLKRLARILSEQQHGLAHLTRILQDTQRDLAIISADRKSVV